MALNYVHLLRQGDVYSTKVTQELGQSLDDLQRMAHAGVDSIRVFGVPRNILHGVLTMANQFVEESNSGKTLQINNLEFRIRQLQFTVESKPYLLN